MKKKDTSHLFIGSSGDIKPPKSKTTYAKAFTWIAIAIITIALITVWVVKFNQYNHH